MITQKYNLNLIPNKVPVIVNASQYDKTSRTLEFTIYDDTELFTIPSGSTVTIRGTKPDKTGFEYPCTFNGSVVSVDIQNQMTVISGKIPVEIRIVNSGNILGTANFILNVECTTLVDDTIISETDLPLLEEAEQNAIRAETAADRAEQVVVDVEEDISRIVSELSNKMNLLSSPTANDILLVDSNGQAIDSGVKVAYLKVLVVTSSSFNSLPQTITNANITSDMVVVNSVLSNPSAQTEDWTVATNNGSVTITGSISGSTTLTLYLEKQR